MPILIAV